jgi:biotin operon repressor
MRYIPPKPKKSDGAEFSPFGYCPDKSIGRTFRVVFEFPPDLGEEKATKRKTSRACLNPVSLAWEWENALKSGNYQSQTALARDLGLSRVRVTQVLNLLRLAPEVIEQVAGLGDPLTTRSVTERKLRRLVNLPEEKQKSRLRKMLSFKL